MAITAAIADGTIDCIVTDHAPHSAEEKADFEKAPNGVVGMETSLIKTLTGLYHTGTISLMHIKVRLMRINPRKILGIDGGSLLHRRYCGHCNIRLTKKLDGRPEKAPLKVKEHLLQGMTLSGRVQSTRW